MKIFKSCIAILLTILLVGSVVSVAVLSTTAAEVSNGITVNANAQGASLTSKVISTNKLETIKVVYSLQADIKLINGQGVITYNDSQLELVDFSLPLCQSGAVTNTKLDDKIKFNFSNLSLYDYTTATEFCVITFKQKATAPFTTNVALNFEELNGDNNPQNDDKTVYVEDGKNVNDYKIACAINAVYPTEPTTKPTVKPTVKPAPAPTIKATSTKINAGKTTTVKVTNGTVKTWKSSKTKVATVSKGKVTALGKGTATITATLTNGKKLSVKITVKSSPKLTTTKGKAAKTVVIKKGKTTTLKVVGKASSIKNTYKNKNKKIAKITTTNKNATKIKIKGIKKGTTYVYVTVNKNYKQKVKVKVK